MEKYDLPLLSNIDKVRVRHYLIEFFTDISNKCLEGTVILFIDLTTKCEKLEETCSANCNCKKRMKFDESEEITTFPIILECSNILIDTVCKLKYDNATDIEAYLSSIHTRKEENDFKYWSNFPKEKLLFTQSNWSIEIQKESLYSYTDFPNVLFIKYKTKQEGISLSWRKSVDNSSCFFTCGSNINNRSLIPCQDRPSAMATWQAWIYVPKTYTVSMTGDKEPTVSDYVINNNNLVCYYFFTTMVLPIATIAIAVGQWEKVNLITQEEAILFNGQYEAVSSSDETNLAIKCKHVPYACHLKKEKADNPLIQVSLIVSVSLLDKARKLLLFVKYLLLATYKLLGKYPFERLEIVILPRCFPNLGFASPSVIYLSQSVLVDDSFLYIRLAHELR